MLEWNGFFIVRKLSLRQRFEVFRQKYIFWLIHQRIPCLHLTSSVKPTLHVWTFSVVVLFSSSLAAPCFFYHPLSNMSTVCPLNMSKSFYFSLSNFVSKPLNLNCLWYTNFRSCLLWSLPLKIWTSSSVFCWFHCVQIIQIMAGLIF